VIGLDVMFVFDQVVSSDLLGMYNYCELKVLGRVALLMVLQPVGSISYNSSILHQNTTKSLSGCITMDHEVLLNVR
jgi:hypothetical protein